MFCQAFQDQLIYLSWLLMWFEAVSRLRINLEKSELIPVRRVENIDDLALDFGCRVGSLLSTYLGLPLGWWQLGAKTTLSKMGSGVLK